MSAAQHTPGPWSAAPRPWSFDFVRGQAAIVDADGQPVAFVSSTRGKFEPEKANAEHTIQCVNAHDQLLDACEETLGCLNGAEIALPGYVVAALERAIAKATGSTS